MTMITRFPFRKLRSIIVPGLLIGIILVVYMYISWEVVENDVTIQEESITIPAPNVTSEFTTLKFDFQNYLNKTGNLLNYNVHIFYYVWYGNLQVDKRWIHWNHKRLPHWNKGLVNEYPVDDHFPPDDIGADFYPALGLYSSRDEAIIRQHMQMIKYTGIGVVVVSWYSNNRSDPNGVPTDDLINVVLDQADQLHLKVALHMEPYDGRSIFSVREDLSYIYKKYTNHSAYFKKPRFRTSKPLPVVFIYDSYLISTNEWVQILGKKRKRTIRDTPNDFFVVGLLLERDSCSDLAASEFDAGYTYFAGEQVSYSSASKHWTEINRMCTLKNLEFYPSIGPGYKDSSVRPWNDFVTQNREDGRYYSKRFSMMKQSGSRSFGVTSFNEWHEGTQIEPAVPHSHSNARLIYENYLPNSPMHYLDLTKKFVRSFTSDTDNVPFTDRH